MKVGLTKTAAIVLLSATALILIVSASAYAATATTGKNAKKSFTVESLGASKEGDADLQISKIEKDIAAQQKLLDDPKTLQAKNHEAMVMGAKEQIKMLEAQKTSLLMDQIDEKAADDTDFNDFDFED
jgi:hypothetical protein